MPNAPLPDSTSKPSSGGHQTSPGSDAASFNDLLRRTTAHLMRLRTDELIDGVRTALRWIGERAGVDRVVLLFYNVGAHLPEHALEWTGPDVAPVCHNVPSDWHGRSIFPTLADGPVRIPDTEAPSVCIPDCELLESTQIRAMLIVPIELRDQDYAVIGMDMTYDPREWTDDDVVCLTTLGEILALAIHRFEAERGSIQMQRKLRLMARLNSVGEVAAVLAHELNQPLAAIVNYSAACHRSAINGTLGQDDLINDLSHIERQSHRAASIIHRLRSFVGGATPRARVSLNELIREVIPLLHPDPSDLGVDIEVDLDPTLPDVIVDRVQIEQVLANLCRNGIEAMAHESDEQQRLSIETHLNEDGSVEVSISDRGEGIDPDNAQALFTSFNTTKPGGMGLGLAIARRIIDDHEGRLGWRPREHGGSTFFFQLPSHAPERP